MLTFPAEPHLHVEATKVGFPPAAVRVRYRSVGDSTPRGDMKRTVEDAVLDYWIDCANDAKDLDASRANWPYLQSQLVVDEEFDVVITRELGLRHPALPSHLEGSIPVLVACPYTSPNGGSVTEVEVNALGHTRRVRPVPSHSLRDLAPLDEGELAAAEDAFVCIPLTAKETHCSPTVSISWTTPGSARTDSFRPSRFLPITDIRTSFIREGVPESVQLELPDHANADHIALEFSAHLLMFSGLRNSIPILDEVVLSDKESPAPAALMAASTRTRMLTIAQDHRALFQQIITMIHVKIDELGLATLINSRTRLTKKWAGGAVRALAQIDAWNSRMPATPTSEEVRAATLELAEILRSANGMKFVIPFRLSGSSVVELKNVRALANNPQRIAILWEGLRAPFTSEREPSSLGPGSAISMFFLAAVLGFLSWISWEWLPDAWTIPRSSTGASPEMNDIRDALVTVLILFPAALYGQFFQHRPKSAAGLKAQLSTFTLFSLLFFLPLGPAAWIAMGGDVSSTSQILMAGAAVAILAGMLIALVLWPSTLLSFRLQNIRSMKAGSPAPPPTDERH